MPFGEAAAQPVPPGLVTPEFTLRPITPDDAALDHAALMDTREDLRTWQQSTWPEDDFTIEANRKDLVDLEQRHLARRAFTYTVLSPDGTRCLGCVYVFPTSATFLSKSSVTRRSGAEWSDVEAVVYFWVRRPEADAGLDRPLLEALRAWFAAEWQLERAVYATSERFDQQVALLRGSGMQVRFELREPGKPGTYLLFG